MNSLCKVASIAGTVLVMLGAYGLFVPRLTSDDGSLVIAGAVLIGAGLIAGALSPGNRDQDR